MLANQSVVPRFPIPKLEDTLKRYKEASSALLSPLEYEILSKTVDQFALSDGPELQRLLMEIDKEAAYNWMEGYWSSMYLDLRCPMPVNVNPFLILGDDPNTKKGSNQVLRAASLVVAATKFGILVRSQQLEPEIVSGSPLCMNGFTQLIGGTRVPHPGRDQYIVNSTSNHIVVFCCNIPYKVTVIASDGSAVPEPEVARQLQAIVNHARELRYSPEAIYSIGIGTTEDRDVWSNLKGKLQNLSPENRKAIQNIDDSLFIMSLEDVIPCNLTDFSKTSLWGNPKNRYFDKLSLIVTPDGQASCNMEHTGYDGQVLARFLLDIYEDSIKSAPEVQFSNLPIPEKLTIQSNAEIRALIDKADANWNSFIAINDLEILDFSKFGKNKVKTSKLPPDAFFQTAVQIANKKTFGKLVSTYESSSVRNYLHGRTETIRPLTVPMRDFIAKFENPNISKAEKYEALQQAAKGHQTVVKNSKTGSGIDRHLQGLYWTSLQKTKRNYQYQVPKFFADGYYSNYMSNLCSTSNVGGDFQGIKLFGFGAVHNDGVGIGYLINSDSFVACITSYSQKAKVWKKYMEEALVELGKLAEQ